jgi:diguanylate cyclase (GGDEF)-like protein
MLARLNIWLKQRSPYQVTFASLIFVVALAAVDHATGYELSFSIFYLFPIALAAWYGGRHQGIFLCIVSAAVWFIVDRTSGHHYSRAFIPYWNAGVRFIFFILTTELLTTLKDQLEKEQIMARLDGLTGAMNGRAFREDAQTILRIASRYGRPTVIGYIDIDNFKTVNDTLGHTEGDHVLRSVAAILLKSVRGADLIGRMGGDEFAILLPETEYSGATAMFDSLREELLKEAGKKGWPIGFSIGVAVFQIAPPSVDEAIKLADALMYRVKKGGKNNILFDRFDSPERISQQPDERPRKPRGSVSDSSHS